MHITPAIKHPLAYTHLLHTYYTLLHDSMHKSTLFRSEVMSLIQLYIPSEVARATVSELGDLGLVQFRDVIT